MSEQAVIDSIALEIRQAALIGKRLILTPGNYGLDFLKRRGWDALGVPVVRFSNYVGDALDIAASEGLQQVLLVGHIGKLVKLAGGIMNTHSRAADCRNELFCAYAALSGADTALCRALMDAVSTDACIAALDAAGMRQAVVESLLDAIRRRLERRVSYRVGAVMFSNEYGLLGQTGAAAELLAEWKGDKV
jgi:cobalt-precorrin-5B (C1)-methyltransferase